MPEQLALDQLLGNRRAVHLDECPAPAAAERVNRPRDELLAGPVLPVNQHAAVGRRRHRHLLAQLTHRIALAHHRLRAIDARPQRPVLGLEPALPHRVVDDEHRFVERQGLLDEIERAHLDRAHGRLDVPVARDEHHLRVHLPLAETRKRRQAVHAGQPDVEDDEIDGAAGHAVEARLTCRHTLDRVPFVAQYAGERLLDARLIVDD